MDSTRGEVLGVDSKGMSEMISGKHNVDGRADSDWIVNA